MGSGRAFGLSNYINSSTVLTILGKFLFDSNVLNTRGDYFVGCIINDEIKYNPITFGFVSPGIFTNVNYTSHF